MGLNFSCYRIIVTTLNDCRPRNYEINGESLMSWKENVKNYGLISSFLFLFTYFFHYRLNHQVLIPFLIRRPFSAL